MCLTWIIINHDYLEWPYGLRENRLKRFSKKLRTIERRYDYGR